MIYKILSKLELQIEHTLARYLEDIFLVYNLEHQFKTDVVFSLKIESNLHSFKSFW